MTVHGTQQLMAALAAKYKAPEWAFLPQVADGTGSAKVRTADALAMSLWPSRGLHLHGFEVKVSRSDWQKELANPAKAESICRYCDFWWVVVGDASIVKPGELPPTWGLLVPHGKGLKVSTQGPKLTPDPVSRAFLAGLLRKAAEAVAPAWVAPIQSLEREPFDAAYKQGEEAATERAKTNGLLTAKENERLKQAIAEFEEKSGLSINNWNAGNVGAVVGVLLNRRSWQVIMEQERRKLERLKGDYEHQVEQVAAMEAFDFPPQIEEAKAS